MNESIEPVHGKLAILENRINRLVRSRNFREIEAPVIDFQKRMNRVIRRVEKLPREKFRAVDQVMWEALEEDLIHFEQIVAKMEADGSAPQMTPAWTLTLNRN